MAALTDTQVVVDDTFGAMGNTAHVVVVADDFATADRLVSSAREWTASLESSWSRFIASSDIYRLNTAGGRAVRISPDTEVLIRHLIAAHEITEGLFNPFVLPSLIAAGYGTSMAGDDARSCSVATPVAAPSPRDVLLESVDGATWCRLLGGASLDPGGLGKGLAADIIAERLVLAGARGALVSIGGDIRCIGTSPDLDGWRIDIEVLSHPLFGEASIVLRSGAIATSSTHTKRWHGGHHVIDPKTQRPLDEQRIGALRQASVIASNAVWAEVFATVSLVAGSPLAGAMIEARGLAARFETTGGRPITTPGFAAFNASRETAGALDWRTTQ